GSGWACRLARDDAGGGETQSGGQVAAGSDRIRERPIAAGRKRLAVAHKFRSRRQRGSRGEGRRGGQIDGDGEGGGAELRTDGARVCHLNRESHRTVRPRGSATDRA